MELRYNRIDVICQHTREGKIIPMKIRVKDEDGEFQTFVIQGYKDKNTYGEYTLGNEIRVTRCNIYNFECKIHVFGIEKIITISYYAAENVWREGTMLPLRPS